MYKKKENKSFLNTWWGTAIIFFIIMYVVGKCSDATGPQYPLDQNSEGAEYQADQSEMDNRDFDPALMYDIPTSEPDDPIDPYASPLNDSNYSGCPDGCLVHPSGCDIKGNISFDSGEKIYHLPGQEYYSITNIDTSYGERWFCTEAEALANGWRKSSQ